MHDIISLLRTNTGVFLTVIGFFALMFGSFLNVVIARLPIILKQKWRQDCYEFLELNNTPEQNTRIKISLLFPRSYCPKCKTTLRAIDNVPVLSFIFLGGKCHFCKTPISWQYPFVELCTAILCVFVAYKFGFSWQTLAGCLLTCILMAQSGIDCKEKMIPDEITLPALWIGILINYFAIFCDLPTAVLGAVSGYIILWLIYWIFYFITGKEGMGYGDFKLFAMLGAWLGWTMLPLIILLSSTIGALSGAMLLLFGKYDRNSRIPFGPFLAIAAWIALCWGSQINTWYLTYAGL